MSVFTRRFSEGFGTQYTTEEKVKTVVRAVVGVVPLVLYSVMTSKFIRRTFHSITMREADTIRVARIGDSDNVRVGQMATPLAMIYLGAMFCFIDIPQYLRRPEFYVEAVVKMVAVPVLFYLLLHALPGIREDIAVTLSVLLAMPTMTTIAMQAEIQRSDADYSSGMVFMTTLLSIVTIPAVCLLIGHL